MFDLHQEEHYDLSTLTYMQLSVAAISPLYCILLWQQETRRLANASPMLHSVYFSFCMRLSLSVTITLPSMCVIVVLDIISGNGG